MTTVSTQFGQSTIDVVLNEGVSLAKAVTGPNGEVSLQAAGAQQSIGVHSAYLVSSGSQVVNNGTSFSAALSATGYQLIDFSGVSVIGGGNASSGVGSALTDTDGMADIPNSLINVPSWANYVWVTGHISLNEPAAVSPCYLSAHLWRSNSALNAAGTLFGVTADGTPRPTPEAHYHNRAEFGNSTISYRSVVATTGGWIPVMGANEKWYLVVAQNSGGALDTTSGVEQWLTVMFSR